MKISIQPTVYDSCTISCACGNSFITSSTLKAIKVEICSACHPFFTGQQKFVDTEGRIDKFNRKRLQAQENSKQTKTKKDNSGSNYKPTLKEIFAQNSSN